MSYTRRLTDSAHDLQCGAEVLGTGGLVAFPTETVYGLGCDACNRAAVSRIFSVKKRPSSNPLIVHVHDLPAAMEIGVFSPSSERLAERFWPGPLTLLTERRNGCNLSPAVTARSPMVALRVPSHRLARELLSRFGEPVVAPSANLSGRISPTKAAHVLEDLDGQIDAVIDGGDCDHGLESTIVHDTGDGMAILRHGVITPEMINAVIGGLKPVHGTGQHPAAPGQSEHHYAPQTSLRFNVASDDQSRQNELRLGFGSEDNADLNLSESGDLEEAARNLYSMLRQLDQKAQVAGCQSIAVASIPSLGIGIAINDRLRRAVHN